MNKPTVKDFYSGFDFEKMLSNPPSEIEEFLVGEIEFLRMLESRETILEIGCGYGRLLKILSEKGKKVIGIDFSEKLLAQAKNNLADYSNIELLTMNAENLNFDDDFADYTLCLDNTFGNMPGIEEKVLSEMKRVTKKGGKIIVSVFSDKAQNSQIKNYSRLGLKGITNTGNAITSDEGFYSRRFSREDLEALFNKVGLPFQIESVCPCNYIVTSTRF